MKDKTFDAVIIGGSYAGLSAGMALGRSIRNVLIIDSGKPCNRQTPHAHNFITHDGEKPAVISAKALEQVLAYPTVQLVKDAVTDVKGVDLNFELSTASGANYRVKKIIFATGVKDVFPDIKGLSDCWGISVLHCPYCHGYEVRESELGILANGEMAYEMGKLISQWSKELMLFTNGPSELTESQRQSLSKHGIEMVEKELVEIVHQDGYLKKIVFKDGTSKEVKALFAKIPFVQHSEIPEKLGCELTPAGHIKVDMLQKTNVPGIYAAGDCTTQMRALSMAAASGGMAGAMLNKDLTENYF